MRVLLGGFDHFPHTKANQADCMARVDMQDLSHQYTDKIFII